MEQTGKAQGDFARTSGSVANQQRTLNAETENTTAAFGQALLPAMQAVQKIASSMIGVFGGNVTALTAVIGVVAAAAAGVWAINAAMAAYAAITKVLTIQIKGQTVAQIALNVVMRANPIMLVVTALIALGAAFVLAYKHSETFRRIVDAAFDKVKAAAAAAWNWIKAHWPQLLAVITGPFAAAVLIITRNWDKIEDGARAAVNALKNIWNSFADFLGNMVDRVGNIAAASPTPSRPRSTPSSAPGTVSPSRSPGSRSRRSRSPARRSVAARSAANGSTSPTFPGSPPAGSSPARPSR